MREGTGAALLSSDFFFFAYFNLDLLFINIERTSWSKNPDNGFLKEPRRMGGGLDGVHSRALFVRLSQGETGKVT